MWLLPKEYEHNFEKREPPAGNYAGTYDTSSVLHYSAQAFADPKNEITIFPYFDEVENLGQRDGFSEVSALILLTFQQLTKLTATEWCKQSEQMVQM